MPHFSKWPGIWSKKCLPGYHWGTWKYKRLRVRRDLRDDFCHFPPKVSIPFLISLVPWRSLSPRVPTDTVLTPFQGGQSTGQLWQLQTAAFHWMKSASPSLTLYFRVCLHRRPKCRKSTYHLYCELWRCGFIERKHFHGNAFRSDNWKEGRAPGNPQRTPGLFGDKCSHAWEKMRRGHENWASTVGFQTPTML